MAHGRLWPLATYCTAAPPRSLPGHSGNRQADVYCSGRRSLPICDIGRRGSRSGCFGISESFVGLLGLDTGLLDHRPPFFDFGLLEGCQPLWALLLGRRNFKTLGFELLTDAGIAQSFDDSGVEFADDVARRTSWCK